MPSLLWFKRSVLDITTRHPSLCTSSEKRTLAKRSDWAWIQKSGFVRQAAENSGLTPCISRCTTISRGTVTLSVGQAESCPGHNAALSIFQKALGSSSSRNAKRAQPREGTKDESAPARPATPSSGLISAMEISGHHVAVPRKAWRKVDHSYIGPISLGLRGRAGEAKKRKKKGVKLEGSAAVTRGTLQGILARYIHIANPLFKVSKGSSNISPEDPTVDHLLLQVFDDEALTLLRSRGHDVSDIANWTWILTANSSEQAALRLMTLSNATPRNRESRAEAVPTFVYLFLLRRAEINPRALRLLISHAWDRLMNRRNLRWASISMDVGHDTTLNVGSGEGWNKPLEIAHYPKMSETTIMTMIVRLLRHARKIWPAAMTNIASMLTSYVDGVGTRDPMSTVLPLSVQTSARLAFLYNRVLSLLSLPSSQNPMRSVPYHQRAQFNLLKRMNEFEPALAINREGYRAVTRVQLAHRKTIREREWAILKAKSWPPWKEEKFGLDVDKGVEMGISRASASLSRLRESGYSPTAWENAASILAGWDTDRSPTIQTRTIMRSSLKPRRVLSKVSSNPDLDVDLWAARIRATRTVDEGWACFLAYKDHRLPPSQTVYHAMFEKLVFDGKRRRAQGTTSSRNVSTPPIQKDFDLPGDGKEVFPAPVSPREAIYVLTPSPSIPGLFDTMIADGLQPSGRFLAFLLSHAESIGAGLKYLCSSPLPPRTIQTLLAQDMPNRAEIHKMLEPMPDYLFASYIRLLSRFSSHPGIQINRHRVQSAVDQDHFSRQSSRPGKTSLHPLMQAMRLMSARMPRYRPAWNSLMAALARPGSSVQKDAEIEDGAVQDISTWNAILGLLDQVHETGLELDFEGFQIVCVGFEKAIHACHRVLLARRKPSVSILDMTSMDRIKLSDALDPSALLLNDAEQLIDNGLPRIKAIFKILVASEYTLTPRPGIEISTHEDLSPATLLPRLLEAPAPAQLHAFIRVLGLAQDYAGVLDLIRWTAQFALELKAVAEESKNGPRLMRRSLVATRVFTERSWTYFESDGDDELETAPGQSDDGATEDIMQQIYHVIESVEDWGGWPTDDEVEAYCLKGRFS
ncbi:hypothetical protein MMC24_005146 [Lignoscripta atroalba]|nr:hypothetical protein [Lignoscripta atroalba]